MLAFDALSLGGIQFNLLLACANHPCQRHGESITRGWNIPRKLKLAALENMDVGFVRAEVKYSYGPLLILTQIGGSPKLLQCMRLSQ